MNKNYYMKTMLKGKPLLFWAVEWFRNSNDDFFYKYGFNFNPHDYPNLYLIARNEVYGSR